MAWSFDAAIWLSVTFWRVGSVTSGEEVGGGVGAVSSAMASGRGGVPNQLIVYCCAMIICGLNGEEDENSRFDLNLGSFVDDPIYIRQLGLENPWICCSIWQGGTMDKS